MRNVYDAVKHLKWKFVDWEKATASKKDKEALKLIIAYLRNEKKEKVSEYQLFYKMYLTVLQGCLKKYKDINTAQRVLDKYLKQKVDVIFDNFLNDLNRNEYFLYLDYLGIEKEKEITVIKPITEEQSNLNKEILAKNSEKVLELSTEGMFSVDHTQDLLNRNWTILFNSISHRE